MNRRTCIALLGSALALAACDAAEPIEGDEAPVDGPLGKADAIDPDAEVDLMAAQCWDSSFAYNVLTVHELPGRFDVRVQGAYLNVIDLHQDRAWEPARLELSFDADDCKRYDAGTLLTCQATEVDATVRPELGEPMSEGTLHTVVLQLSEITRRTAEFSFTGHEVLLTTSNADFESRETRFSVPGFGGVSGCNYDPDTFQF